MGVFAAVLVAMTSPLKAQGSLRPPASPVLRELDRAIQSLATRVAPSVVQVLVSGYRSVDANRGKTGVVIGRQRSIGSGAIIDADGYIVTNAHVVAGAQQVRVALHTGVAAGPLQSLTSDDAITMPARIVGTAEDIDLALLKIDRTGLPSLPLANYDDVRAGALVFAFGSPDGLRNSMTMGVVSAAARQTEPDSPAIYIQTDAPINPGNSGGPLVNANGELVGLNTFIVSESGGSEGLGFAIPSVVIAAAYPQLKTYGHLRRGVIGVSIQTITPPLADGLNLPRSSGVIVSDVLPDSPAAAAGIQLRDIITAVDGKAIDNVPMFTLVLSTRAAGDTVALRVLRNARPLTVRVPVVEQSRESDRLRNLNDPATNGVPALGVVAADLNEDTRALLPDLRIPSGVLVIARRQGFAGDTPLETGDVIHEFNGITVRSLDGLRVLTDGSNSNDEVVLQIERDRRLMYVTITLH